MLPTTAADPYKVVIVRITEGTPTNVGGVVTKQLQLSYMIGAFGPFTWAYNETDWKPQEVSGYLLAQAAKLRQVNEVL
jgi:hypothetical protein